MSGEHAVFVPPPFLIDTCWWNSKRLSRVIRTKKISFIELVNCWIVMFIDSSWSVQSLEKKYQHGRCVDRKSRNTSTRWAGGYYVTAALTRLNEFDDYKTHCYVDRLVLLLTTAKEGLDVISYWWREGYECKGVKRYRFFFSLSLYWWRDAIVGRFHLPTRRHEPNKFSTTAFLSPGFFTLFCSS